uniref:Putative secreted protein n=1 Tax=Anopheles darlingi TaxID=43151 RepID=A0A2M4D2P1_ANODA
MMMMMIALQKRFSCASIVCQVRCGAARFLSVPVPRLNSRPVHLLHRWHSLYHAVGGHAGPRKHKEHTRYIYKSSDAVQNPKQKRIRWVKQLNRLTWCIIIPKTSANTRKQKCGRHAEGHYRKT